MVSKKLTLEASKESAATLKRVVLDQMRSNSHGFFLQNSEVNLRTMQAKEAEEALSLMDMDNAMIHLRMVSSGAKNESNIHGWTIGDYQFIHNGGISTYNFWGKTQQESDSLLFFKDLNYNLDYYHAKSDKQVARTIKDVLSLCNFWGRAMLYNRRTDKAYLFGDWHAYLLKKEYLVLSSAKIYAHTIKGNAEVVKVHGLEFEPDKMADMIEETFDGLAIITNYSKPNWHFRIADRDFEDSKYVASRTVYTICKNLLDEQKETNEEVEAEELEYDIFDQPIPKAKDNLSCELGGKSRVRQNTDHYGLNRSVHDLSQRADEDELNFRYTGGYQGMEEEIIDDQGTPRWVRVYEYGVHDTDGYCCDMIPKQCPRLYEIYYHEGGISEIYEEECMIEEMEIAKQKSPAEIKAVAAHKSGAVEETESGITIVKGFDYKNMDFEKVEVPDKVAALDEI